jgi:hypothetical protein
LHARNPFHYAAGKAPVELSAGRDLASCSTATTPEKLLIGRRQRAEVFHSVAMAYETDAVQA